MSFNDYSKINESDDQKSVKSKSNLVNKQITVEVRLVGVFRNYFTKNSFTIEVAKSTDVYDLIEYLDNLSSKISIQGQVKSLKDHIFQNTKRADNRNSNQLNPWIRVMLNGRDIAFLDQVEMTLNDKDVVIFMSALAGG